MTQDVDLLLRGTVPNDQKLDELCRLLGATGLHQIEDLTAAKTLVGAGYPVDILFDEMAGGLSFESVRSRAVEITVGDAKLRVASLEDIIKSKEAANRDKDKVALPILRQTLAIKKAMT
jgi:hypothetical protein